MVDIELIFRDYGIPYKTSGKNVSSGWIETTCPMPYCSDSSWHMGVNLSSGAYHCWICGAKGHIKKLLTILLGISYGESERIIQRYDRGTFPREDMPQEAFSRKTHTCLPKECSGVMPELHRNYLLKRNFDPEEIERKYDLRFSHFTGQYCYRIIIPIYKCGDLVTFTSRDVTEKQEPRYKNQPAAEAVCPAKQCLYNIDSIKKERVIIVEGPADVWRLGELSIATMGTEVSSKQILEIRDKNINKAFVMFDSRKKDPSAPRKAEALAARISAFVKYVEVLYLDDGDPSDMLPDDANHLVKTLF